MLEVCAEVRAVHGERVRAEVCVQAGTGDGHVPGSVLPLLAVRELQQRLRSRRWREQQLDWMRLRQLRSSPGIRLSV
jgi:hypothetical protein